MLSSGHPPPYLDLRLAHFAPGNKKPAEAGSF
jgi:hypothetical protein